MKAFMWFWSGEKDPTAFRARRNDIEAFPQMIWARFIWEYLREPRRGTAEEIAGSPQQSDQRRVALLLRARGITRVRPLKGDECWLAYKFPFGTESLVRSPLSFERWYFSQPLVPPKNRNAKYKG